MPAFLYERIHKNEIEILHQVRKVPMAGRYLIQSHWERKGRPINQGWHISEMEMVFQKDHLSEKEKDRITKNFSPSIKSKTSGTELSIIFLSLYPQRQHLSSKTFSRISNFRR